MALHDAGQEDLALSKYLQALELDFQRSSTCYNIGLIYKYRNQWQESLRYNARAHQLDPDDEATCWNLAIAATALRDWTTARRVWHGRGMGIEEGSESIEEDFGRTPVRLNPDGDAEVVWGRRIDPVRVRILNIPMPESGYRHGDVVLHDGAPVGYRESNGREYPVFNVLELFEQSSCVTVAAELLAPDQQDVDALEAICDELGIAFEDWTSSFRILCKKCSEGRPHEHHHHATEADAGWNEHRRVAFAADSKARVDEALQRWQTSTRKVLGAVQ